jgi:hypothetical protein
MSPLVILYWTAQIRYGPFSSHCHGRTFERAAPSHSFDFCELRRRELSLHRSQMLLHQAFKEGRVGAGLHARNWRSIPRCPIEKLHGALPVSVDLRLARRTLGGQSGLGPVPAGTIGGETLRRFGECLRVGETEVKSGLGIAPRSFESPDNRCESIPWAKRRRTHFQRSADLRHLQEPPPSNP